MVRCSAARNAGACAAAAGGDDDDDDDDALGLRSISAADRLSSELWRARGSEGVRSPT